MLTVQVYRGLPGLMVSSAPVVKLIDVPSDLGLALLYGLVYSSYCCLVLFYFAPTPSFACPPCDVLYRCSRKRLYLRQLRQLGSAHSCWKFLRSLGTLR